MNEAMRSFTRVRNAGLAKRFYELFLAADPRFKEMFRKTDFIKQGELLTHGILVLLQYADGAATGEMAVRRIGELHRPDKINVTPDMYPIWVDCLMKAISEIDPEFTPELERQWRRALQKGIDTMIQMR
jgi:hemoglobin-like flavoprotein